MHQPAPAEAVHFGPDDRKVASVGRDPVVRIFDVRTGALERTLEGHSRRIFELAWNPDGAHIASASVDGTVRIWNRADGSTEKVLSPAIGRIYSVTYTPSGSSLITTSEDSITRIWDAQTGRVQASYRAVLRIQAATDPRGERVVSATGLTTAQVWRLSDGNLISELVGHGGDVLVADWSPDGALAITASLDGQARVWDPTTGELLGAVKGRGDQVWAAHFSPHGDRILLVGSGGGELSQVPHWRGTPADLEQLLRCRVPFEIEAEHAVRRRRDPSACAVQTGLHE
jgi:WD40 repeat protein